MASCRLYLITPAILPDSVSFAAILATVLESGNVASVQLRLKGVDDTTLMRTIDMLRPVVQSHNAMFLLNDRPDLAARSGCDGVHLGQNDTAYAKARQLVGNDAIIGMTCHNSHHLAILAAKQGANYVAFGTFFPTLTKTPQSWASFSLIKWWSELMTIPCVAVGGITINNCIHLVRAGADFIAVSAGVWRHPAGPAAAVACFGNILRSYECNSTI